MSSTHSTPEKWKLSKLLELKTAMINIFFCCYVWACRGAVAPSWLLSLCLSLFSFCPSLSLCCSLVPTFHFELPWCLDMEWWSWCANPPLDMPLSVQSDWLGSDTWRPLLYLGYLQSGDLTLISLAEVSFCGPWSAFTGCGGLREGYQLDRSPGLSIPAGGFCLERAGWGGPTSQRHIGPGTWMALNWCGL